MKKTQFAGIFVFSAILFSTVFPISAQADDPPTLVAARMSAAITGGQLLPSDDAFVKMVSQIQASDYYGAAMTAIHTPYFSKYLADWMAKEMMSPALTAMGIPDNDATLAIVANLTGSGTTANISKLWSDNNTYLISTARGNLHIMDLSATELAAANFSTDIVQVPGQSASDGKGDNNGNVIMIPIPAKHVGGYLTLSDRKNDQSIAQYGLQAGTNLRAIEAMWEVATGFSLTDMASMNGASALYVPRFVPENDSNFFSGNGQAACTSCHSGGASNLTHGYAAFADVFDFDPKNGLVYIASPTKNTMKSLGSDPNTRTKVATCDTTKFSTCNPDSMYVGADPNQAWNVMDFDVISKMNWTGPKTGQGLNSLGAALGQAAIVYKFLVQRTADILCPLGSLADFQKTSIASAAQAADDFRVIVASIASDPSCR